MRFHHRQPPPPLLNRRQQWRLFMLVLMLVLVVSAFRSARKPENWHWFFELSGQPVQNDRPALKDVDFHVETDDGPLPPDVFRSEIAAEPSPEVHESPAEPSTELPAGLLDKIKDNHLGALRAEQPALDRVIDKVRKLTSEQMEAAAERDVGFTVLMVNTDQYRGRIIRLHGALRRFEPYDVGDPDDAGDDLYEAWMFTGDSGNNPYRILVVEAPQNLPRGPLLNVEAEASAYFFKKYGYVSQGGTHVAPLLIAKTLRVRPPRPAAVPERGDQLSRFTLGFFVITGGVFALIAGWFAFSDRRFRRGRLQELADARLAARSEDLDALQQADVIDPKSLFREFEDRA